MSYIFLLWFIISYLDDEEAGNVFINISLWISNNKTYYPRGVNVFATSFLSYQYIHNIYIYIIVFIYILISFITTIICIYIVKNHRKRCHLKKKKKGILNHTIYTDYKASNKQLHRRDLIIVA